MSNGVARTRIGNVRIKDGFQNFEAALGLGTNNQMASSRYGYTPITRDRQQLDFMYRGSWVVRQAIGVPADDMTRAGVEFYGMDEGHDPVLLQNSLRRLDVWGKLASTIRWARLYGGALAVILIEGQDLGEPLRPETVTKGQFKGLLPLDRWNVTVSPTTVDELGPDFGKPALYMLTNADGRTLTDRFIHHTRVVRIEGDDLPYYQRQAEQGWGMSVVETFHDRLVAFDSTTIGMAQMVYKAHLRTLAMKDLRRNIAEGGKAYAAALTNVDLIRRYQSSEGMTLIDSEDKFQTDSYTFGGLSDVMIQMSQQIAGAIDMPIVKLFGMSPAGFSTGEADLRSYNDNIHLKQERDLRRPLEVVAHVAYRSEFGTDVPDEFGFKFASLYGLNAVEKAEIADKVASAVSSAEATGALGKATILRELKASSDTTGIFQSITDDDIVRAEKDDLLPDLGEPPIPGSEVNPISDPTHVIPAREEQEEFEKRPFPLARPRLIAAE